MYIGGVQKDAVETLYVEGPGHIGTSLIARSFLASRGGLQLVQQAHSSVFDRDYNP